MNHSSHTGNGLIQKENSAELQVELHVVLQNIPRLFYPSFITKKKEQKLNSEAGAFVYILQ